MEDQFPPEHTHLTRSTVGPPVFVPTSPVNKSRTHTVKRELGPEHEDGNPIANRRLPIHDVCYGL